MKRFLLKVLLYFACVVVIDFAFGLFFSYLRAHAKGGSTANCEYIANKATDDIIILGSSRATHHYIPQIIEDSLGVSCYNCGEEGNGVVLAYGRLKMLTNRYKPQLILYEITPGFDYGTSEPNTKYLGYLRPYYNKNGIKEIFRDFDDALFFLKMKSSMYQNTSRLLPNIVDNIIYRDNLKGYSPLYGKIDNKNNPETLIKGKQDIDSLKLSYIERLIKEAQNKGVQIIFMISPKYGSDNEASSYEPEISLCDKYNIPYYNYSNNDTIANNASYFQDDVHMNNEGAIAYTKIIINEVLNKYIKK